MKLKAIWPFAFFAVAGVVFYAYATVSGMVFWESNVERNEGYTRTYRAGGARFYHK